MIVKSRFSIVNVYCLFIFYAGLLSVGLYIGLKPANTSVENNPGAPPAILVLVALVLIVIQLRIVKRVMIEPGRIIIGNIFGKEVIEIGNLESINLFARGTHSLYSSYGKLNGILYTRTNGNEIFVPDYRYQNIAELKNALETNFANKVEPRTKNRISSQNTILSNDPEKFSGNAFFSVPNLLFIGSFIGVYFVLNHNPLPNNGNLIIFLLFFAIFYLLFGIQMSYFIIADNRLTIKNYYFPWMKKEFELAEIENVVTEHTFRQSNALRVNFKNFRTRKFAAGTLRDKDWQRLADKFVSIGIPASIEPF